MNDIEMAQKELAEYKLLVSQRSIQELINAVNLFSIGTVSQIGCAMDIKKLEIITHYLVDRVTPRKLPAPIAPPENIKGSIVSTKI